MSRELPEAAINGGSVQEQRPWAIAVTWMGRVFAVLAEVALLVWLGQYLASRFDLPLLTIAAAILGSFIGLAHLVWMAQRQIEIDRDRKKNGDAHRHSQPD